MYRCQQNLIKSDPILEFICRESNKLTNQGIYYAREKFFKTGTCIGKYDLRAEYKSSKHFQALHSQVAQETLGSVYESFRSYKGLLKLWYKGELTHKPKLPNYRTKDGLAIVSYPKQALKLKDNQIRLPLGQLVNTWFGIDSFHIPFPSNLDFSQIREVRILPRNGCFYAEFVYKVNTVEFDLDPAKALGIDPGLNNWLTCVSNVGTSFLIDGLKLKSLNQWYNKRIAVLRKNQPQGFWSKQLSAISEKRNRRFRDAVNKSAKLVVKHCLENGIGTIVFGWNKGQKTRTSLGAKTNQNFVQIPTGKLKERIRQLCEQFNIRFIETEESYTSKASFIDQDILPTFGEKPEGWSPSGKRVKRGLYQSAEKFLINADCNGAANILRKVAITEGLDLSGISRGVLTTPLRVRFWTA